MTPANDAFTLGLPHDHARIGLRSSSKIPFVSSQKARSPSATPRRPSRQMSVDLPDPKPSARPLSSQPNGHASAPNGDVRQRKKPRTTSATPTHLAKLTKPKPPKAPVDWEIPRKTLHSSIGAFHFFLVQRTRPLIGPLRQASSLGTSTPPKATRARSCTPSASPSPSSSPQTSSV